MTVSLQPSVTVVIRDPAEKGRDGDCLVSLFLAWQAKALIFPLRESGGTSCRWFYSATFAADDAPEIEAAIGRIRRGLQQELQRADGARGNR